MTRAEFAGLQGSQHVDAAIAFDHGPDRAAIHHDIRDSSVRYVLSRYPAFDSIRIIRVIPARTSAYAGESMESAAGGL